MFISTEEDFEEPVTLEGLKAYLALRDADRPDDSYLKGLVTTARAMLEDEGGLERVIVPRSFELTFSEEQCVDTVLHLYPSLIEVERIIYSDAEGEEHEITDYGVELGLKAELWFDWPEDADGDVTVYFTSGYEQYPQCILLAIKMMCKSMYARTEGSPLSPEIRDVIRSEVVLSV